jgi:Bacteriophage T4, Gp8.
MNQPLLYLEPRAAGSSGDGYIWKYLYTIKPSQAIKFDSTDYIPVPNNWYTSSDDAPVRTKCLLLVDN